MDWDNIAEIIEQLEENYHEEVIEELSLQDIEEMVRSLGEFTDQETIVTKQLLNDILETWLEYRGNK